MRRFYRPIGHALGFCSGGMNDCFVDNTFDEGIPLSEIELEIEEHRDIFQEWPDEVLEVYNLLKYGRLENEDADFNLHFFFQFFGCFSILCSFWAWWWSNHSWQQRIAIHLSWRDFTILDLCHWQRFWLDRYSGFTHWGESLHFTILGSKEVAGRIDRVSPR